MLKSAWPPIPATSGTPSRRSSRRCGRSATGHGSGSGLARVIRPFSAPRAARTTAAARGAGRLDAGPGGVSTNGRKLAGRGSAAVHDHLPAGDAERREATRRRPLDRVVRGGLAELRLLLLLLLRRA